MACSFASNRTDGILGEQHWRSFGLDCGASARGPGANPGTLRSKMAKLRSDGVRAQQYCDGSGGSGEYKYRQAALQTVQRVDRHCDGRLTWGGLVAHCNLTDCQTPPRWDGTSGPYHGECAIELSRQLASSSIIPSASKSTGIPYCWWARVKLHFRCSTLPHGFYVCCYADRLAEAASSSAEECF